MYVYIRAEHTVDTIEYHGQIKWRITNLKLPPQPTSTQMTEHLNHFQQLIAELLMAGGVIAESVKCECFILTFPADMRKILQNYRLIPLLDRTWRNLLHSYRKELKATRIDEMNATNAASVNALYNASKPKDGKEKGKPKQGTKGKGQGKKQKDQNAPKCHWCGSPNQQEKDCRKKAAGEPSKAEKHATKRKKLKGKPKGAVNHVNADRWNASNSTSNIFGVIHHVFDIDYSTQSFLIDSAATHHLVCDQNLLYDVISTPTITLGLAGLDLCRLWRRVHFEGLVTSLLMTSTLSPGYESISFW